MATRKRVRTPTSNYAIIAGQGCGSFYCVLFVGVSGLCVELSALNSHNHPIDIIASYHDFKAIPRVFRVYWIDNNTLQTSSIAGHVQNTVTRSQRHCLPAAGLLHSFTSPGPPPSRPITALEVYKILPAASKPRHVTAEAILYHCA